MARAVEHDVGGAARDARRVDHADRDARHLPRDQARPAGPGKQLLPALDGARLPRRLECADRLAGPARRHVRARTDLQPRVRHLHGRLAAADDRLDDGARRRHLPDRVPDRAGHRRRLPARQLGRDLDRRVPGQPARDGARHQQHRRRQWLVHRADPRRPTGPDQLAHGVPDLGPGRPVRDGLGLHEAPGAEHAAALARRLAGQHHVRSRTDSDHGLDHVRDQALRTSRDRVDEPSRADPAGGGRGIADRVRGGRAPRQGSDVQPCAAAHPRVQLRDALDVPVGDRARRI